MESEKSKHYQLEHEHLTDIISINDICMDIENKLINKIKNNKYNDNNIINLNDIKLLFMKKLLSSNVNEIENRIKIKGVHFYPPETENNINDDEKFKIKKALTLGAKYVPIPSIKNQKIIQNDLMNNFKDFKRKLKTKVFFMTKDGFNNKDYNPNFYLKSTNNFEPEDKYIDDNILKFFKNMENDLDDKIQQFNQNEKTIFKQLRRQYNINESQQFIQIVDQISKDSKFVIRPADKNLGLTIMDSNWYDNEILNQLDNTRYYIKCQNSKEDIVDEVLMKYETILQKFPVDHINEKYYEFLQNSPQVNSCLTKIPKFYILPKLHKEVVKGRPIVASCNWITTPISKYCNWVLQKEILEKINELSSSILKNSMQLVNELEDLEINTSSILVTCDIESLYTNINQNKAAEIILSILMKNFNDNMGFCMIHPLLIHKYLEFIFDNNYINFNDAIYKQHYGIAMGTPVAPIIANIYMWDIESKLFQKLKEINSKLIPFKYYRYLDDIFMIWNSSIDDLLAFKNLFNSMDSNIKMTMVHNNNEIDYLDLVIFKNEFNKINFKVHQKNLNKYLYMPFNSNHPKHIGKGIVKTELIRYIRNSSNRNDYIAIKKEFYQRLRDRGYPEHMLLNEFNNKIFYKDRRKYLDKIKHKNSEYNIVPFINTYCPLMNIFKINHTITLNWTKIMDNENISNKLNSIKPMVSWKMSNNILKIINKNNRFKQNKDKEGIEDNKDLQSF
jgi:hypothetical protein